MLELYGSLYQVLLEDLSWTVNWKRRLDLCGVPHSSVKLEEIGLLKAMGIISDSGSRSRIHDQQPQTDSFPQYLKARKWVDWWTWGQLGTAIAILHLEGSIVDFEQDQQGLLQTGRQATGAVDGNDVGGGFSRSVSRWICYWIRSYCNRG